MSRDFLLELPNPYGVQIRDSTASAINRVHVRAFGFLVKYCTPFLPTTLPLSTTDLSCISIMANTGNPTSSSCRFSTRVSLRWLPEPAHETTDTIVMSVKDWYLDLRMDKQTGEIDWAIAGQRLIESEEPRLSPERFRQS